MEELLQAPTARQPPGDRNGGHRPTFFFFFQFWFGTKSESWSNFFHFSIFFAFQEQHDHYFCFVFTSQLASEFSYCQGLLSNSIIQDAYYLENPVGGHMNSHFFYSFQWKSRWTCLTVSALPPVSPNRVTDFKLRITMMILVANLFFLCLLVFMRCFSHFQCAVPGTMLCRSRNFRRQLIDQGDELRQLLAEPTARQSSLAERPAAAFFWIQRCSTSQDQPCLFPKFVSKDVQQFRILWAGLFWEKANSGMIRVRKQKWVLLGHSYLPRHPLVKWWLSGFTAQKFMNKSGPRACGTPRIGV